MKPDKRAIKRLVDAALREKSRAAFHAGRENAIKKKLANLGASFTDEWEPTEGGGNSWLAQGTDHYARVTYPADKLKVAIDAATDVFDQIKKAAGDKFKHLFEAANFYKPIEGFRTRAVELLGAAPGKKLIKLCQSDNKPTVNFEAGTIADREEKAA